MKHILKISIFALACLAQPALATTQPGDQICSDLETTRAAAIQNDQQAADLDPFLQQVGQQRQADQRCMLDLSKQLGDVVGADTAGLGGIIDQIFSQMNEAACNLVETTTAPSQARTPTYSTTPPQPPATPSLLGPSSGSSGSSVWDRLSDAMGGRVSN